MLVVHLFVVGLLVCLTGCLKRVSFGLEVSVLIAEVMTSIAFGMIDLLFVINFGVELRPNFLWFLTKEFVIFMSSLVMHY